jgi:hypothetical protein
MNYTAKDLVKMIANKHGCGFGNSGGNEFVMATEVSDYSNYARRLDVVLMNTWNSHGFKFSGIEIKVSISDLRSELRVHEKHEFFYDNLDYFSICCPSEVLIAAGKDVLPKKWGILVPDKSGSKLVWKRKPLELHDERQKGVSRGFVASFVSRALHFDAEFDLSAIRAAEYKKGRIDGINAARSDSAISRLTDKSDRFDALLAAADVKEWQLDPDSMAPIIRYAASVKDDSVLYRLRAAQRDISKALEETERFFESIEERR